MVGILLYNKLGLLKFLCYSANEPKVSTNREYQIGHTLGSKWQEMTLEVGIRATR